MRCNICDKELSEKEIQWNPDLDGWECCTICLDVALDAAYGQHRPDDEGVPLLDQTFDELDAWVYPEVYGKQMEDW